MTYEKEVLIRTLDDVRSKIMEASQTSYDQELQVTKSMDRYELLNGEYMNLAHSIGLIAPTGKALKPDDVDYSISAELQSDNIAGIHHEVRRIREALRPSLQTLGDSYRREDLDLGNQIIETEDLYDRLGQDVEKQNQNHTHLNMIVKGANEAADGVKRVCDAVNDIVFWLTFGIESLSRDGYGSCHDRQAGAAHLGGVERHPVRRLARCTRTRQYPHPVGYSQHINKSELTSSVIATRNCNTGRDNCRSPFNSR